MCYVNFMLEVSLILRGVVGDGTDQINIIILKQLKVGQQSSELPTYSRLSPYIGLKGCFLLPS